MEGKGKVRSKVGGEERGKVGGEERGKVGGEERGKVGGEGAGEGWLEEIDLSSPVSRYLLVGREWRAANICMT